jgi:Diacylglycerol kinase
MNTEFEEKKKANRKDLGIKSLFKIFKNSLSGLGYFFKYERSSIVYLLAFGFSIGAGIILQMNLMEWIVIIFVLLSMLSSELLNTAIEAVCDLVSPEYNPLVKIAKDTGSAATGVLSILWVVVIVVIYAPKVWGLLKVIF